MTLKRCYKTVFIRIFDEREREMLKRMWWQEKKRNSNGNLSNRLWSFKMTDIRFYFSGNCLGMYIVYCVSEFSVLHASRHEEMYVCVRPSSPIPSKFCCFAFDFIRFHEVSSLSRNLICRQFFWEINPGRDDVRHQAAAAAAISLPTGVDDFNAPLPPLSLLRSLKMS